MKQNSNIKCRLGILLAICAFVGLLSLAVYGLWNGVLTDVLGVKSITYWQAMGIFVLAKILFGGKPGRAWKLAWFCRGRRYWKSLSPEQREELRRRFSNLPHSSGCDSEGQRSNTSLESQG